MFSPDERAQFVRKSKKAKHLLYKELNYDRRCIFNDLSKQKPEHRTVKSPIIQFYSSVENIGNYTPIIGIQDMLEQPTDTWCIQDKEIDFEFINKNYQCAIIGGAGLAVEDTRGVFENFWRTFLKKCTLPSVIWGIGTDDVWKVSESYRKVVHDVAKRCDLVNVRDDLTAETFNITAHISPCPTIVYLRRFLRERYNQSTSSGQTTFVRYPHQIFDKEVNSLIKVVEKEPYVVGKTTNFQYSFLGLEDIIRRHYIGSEFVTTTMLHAAIISYGLGIPYIAITKTQKISAFQKRFGNGISVKTVGDLRDVLANAEVSKLNMKPIEIDPVLEFGAQAKRWVHSI